MNKVLAWTLIALLLVASLVNGALYYQANSRAERQEAKLSKLSSDLGNVSGNLNGLQSSVSQLSTSLTGLNSSLGGLSGKVSALEGSTAGMSSDINGLKDSTAGLASDVSGLKSGQTSLSSDVTALKNSVNGVASSVAAVNSSLSALQTSVTGMQDTVTGMQDSISDLQANSASVTELAARLEPTVVRILAMITPTSGSVGSGAIIRANGYVLTAYHVIQGGTSITVTLKTGESFKATVAGVNVGFDLAVLKMTSTRTDFPVAAIGSSAAARVGESVLAIGYAEGLPGQASFTKGIISALRTDTNLFYGNGEKFIQTDAAINHGNSGGPLFNMKGEVIGINDLRIFANDSTGDPVDNMGFAIAVDEAKPLIASATGT